MEKIKLMVVDDSREFCLLVRDYVKTVSDVEFCGVAFDGISALDFIKEKKPDVILLDNVMPQLDGIGVMMHLQSFENKDRPKVVAVTTCPTKSYISAMYKLGADYIMSKNTDVNEMIDRCVLAVKSFESREHIYTTDAEMLITSTVCAVGVPAHLKGYSFLRTSIDMVIKNPDIVHSITKQLYPIVAKKYNTTTNKVERNIRNAIEIAWTRGDKHALAEIFGTALDFSGPKPTNSEFIAMLADKLRLKLRENIDINIH